MSSTLYSFDDEITKNHYLSSFNNTPFSANMIMALSQIGKTAHLITNNSIKEQYRPLKVLSKFSTQEFSELAKDDSLFEQFQCLIIIQEHNLIPHLKTDTTPFTDSLDLFKKHHPDIKIVLVDHTSKQIDTPSPAIDHTLYFPYLIGPYDQGIFDYPDNYLNYSTKIDYLLFQDLIEILSFFLINNFQKLPKISFYPGKQIKIQELAQTIKMHSKHHTNKSVFHKLIKFLNKNLYTETLLKPELSDISPLLSFDPSLNNLSKKIEVLNKKIHHKNFLLYQAPKGLH